MNTQDSTAQATRCPDQNELPTGFCSKLVSALTDLKEKLQRRYELAFPGRSEQIRDAVAEAEQQAWETSFPHLLFPDFAEARVAVFARVNTDPSYQRAA